MDERIEAFMNSKRVAVVGVSDRRFGGTIYRNLKKRGYEVFPVHPTRESFDGDRCLPSLAQVPGEVDAAVIAVSPANAAKIVEDAKSAGISKLWFQRGADFSEAREKAKAGGMQTVSSKCILMYAPPVTGFHALHRFFARLFGSI